LQKKVFKIKIKFEILNKDLLKQILVLFPQYGVIFLAVLNKLNTQYKIFKFVSKHDQDDRAARATRDHIPDGHSLDEGSQKLVRLVWLVFFGGNLVLVS
jgi:hypothetical protein